MYSVPVTGGRSSTPPRRTQSERREQTRARVIDATIEAIAHDGYHATTVRRVAEISGSSMGALAHHFPSRQSLITATIDEVGRRTVEEIRALTATIPARGAHRTTALLDAIWVYFASDLFTVWLRVWVAATEDASLYESLAPLERELSRVIAATSADLTPPGVAQRDWNRRWGMALDTMRGLALRRAIEPRDGSRRTDPWPATRAELARVLAG